jgi:hypothetical protein
LTLPPLDWYTLCLAAAAVLLAAGGILVWWRRRPRDPEEIERRRRTHVNTIGRIVEGRVLEISEAPAPAALPAKRSLFSRKKAAPVRRATPRTLVHYSYEISGVSYETAQDVTGMEARACLHRVVAGQPASVKYDPANPSNSILVADDWSGLH